MVSAVLPNEMAYATHHEVYISKHAIKVTETKCC